jgi:hypothetical protein
MTTKIEIYNGALGRISAGRVTGLTEDSDQRRALDDQYDVAVDSTLIAYGWRFATKRVVLALSDTTPVFGYSYQFALPDGHLRTLELYIGMDTDELKWEEEDGFLLTDVNQLAMKYTKLVDDESKFTAKFVDALEYNLASLVCVTLKNNRSLAADMLALFDDRIIKAQVQDAKGRSNRKSKQKSSWLQSRTTPVGSFVNRIVVT